MNRYESTIEEWDDRSLVYLRHPGRVELVIAHPDGGKHIIVPVSKDQVIRLIADAAAYLPELLRERKE